SLHSSCHLHDLHSFPTRRSSDFLTTGKFFLATAHRAENVDREDKLKALVDAFARLHAEFGLPVVWSLHPRTKSKVEDFGISLDRSEEHTSELQSRGHLVCRLLLE